MDSGTIPDDKLFLQIIDENGKKMGKKKLINTPPNREEDAQVVAIDPLGNFVIFTIQTAAGSISIVVRVWQKTSILSFFTTYILIPIPKALIIGVVV